MAFKRTPVLRGNTDVPIVSQPQIVGTVRKDASGNVPGLAAALPAELRVETDQGGPTSVALTTETSLNDVLDTLNAALSGTATAEEVDGVLALTSTGSGGNAFISVHPQAGGLTEAAFVFGFHVTPHPAATVTAGDIETADVRPRSERNPTGTAFVPLGSDRTARAFDRGLAAISRNADHLFRLLSAPIALPIEVQIDVADASWIARIIRDADDNVEQIDLSDLGAIDADWAGRVFVGGLDRNATLHDIASRLKITDAEGREIISNGRVVRVAAVTRGQRVAALPTFASDHVAPGSPLADTSAVAPDGGNALGVALEKVGSTALGTERDRTTIVAPSATFVTDGVLPNDLAVISASTDDTPFSHDGQYRVEAVISEEELILRPDGDGPGELNPGAGGNVVITTDGIFQDEIWISFDPPLPRVASVGDVTYRLYMGVERSLGEVSADTLTRLAIPSASETPGFVMARLWAQFTFGGLYQGPAGARQSGAFGAIDGRPITLRLANAGTVAAGSTVRTYTGGAVVAGNILVADATDTFSEDDLGRLVQLSGGSIPTGLRAVIVGLLVGGQRVILARIDSTPTADIPVTATVTYIVLSGARHELPAGIFLQSPEHYTGTTDTITAGVAYAREQSDTAKTTSADIGSLGFVHLEQVAVRRGPTNVVSLTGTTVAASGNLDLAFDPTSSYNIFADTIDGRSSAHDGAATLVRVLHGADAGWYKVTAVRSSAVTGTNRLQVLTLAGAAVSFTTSAAYAIALYNVAFASHWKTSSTTWMGGRFYADWAQQGSSNNPGALNIGWRGNGRGIYMVLNDSTFEGYDDGDGASGPASDIVAYPPARGHLFTGRAAETGAVARRSMWGVRVAVASHSYDQALSVSAVATADVGAAAWLAQTGKDAGLILTKHDAGTAPAFPSLGGAHLPSTLLIATSTGASGMGTGIDAWSSAWFHRGDGTWDDAAFMTDTTLGVGGRYLYASYGDDLLDMFGGGSDYESTVTLGLPSRLLPGTLEATPTAAVTTPSYGTFNLPHDGVINLGAVTPSTSLPPNLLGLRVVLTSGADTGKEFRIIRRLGDSYALEGPSAITANATVSYQIHGLRWHRAHIDLADWSQIGTALYLGERADLPLETVGRDPTAIATQDPYDVFLQDEAWTSSALTGTITIATTAVTGVGTSFLAQVQEGDYIKTNADGDEFWARVADVASNTSMTLAWSYAGGTLSGAASVSQRAVELAGVGSMSAVDMLGQPATFGVGRRNTTLTNVLAGTPGVSWGTEWQDDLGEPRAPVPNAGVFSRGYRYTSAGSYGIPEGAREVQPSTPGSLLSDDVALEIQEQNSVGGVVASFSTMMGGSIVVQCVGTPDDVDDVARLWFRGARGVSSQLLAYTARAVAYVPEGTVTMMFELRAARSNTLLAASSALVVSADTNPQLQSHAFSASDFLSGAIDALDATTYIEQDVCLVIKITLNDTPANGNRIFFGQVWLEDQTLERKHHGPLAVLGTVRAQDFRHLTPQRGYCTVGPGQADLLEFSEFAKCAQAGDESENPFNFIERQGIGEVFDEPPGDEQWHIPIYHRQLFFRKGPSVAAIRGVIPYYDPLWYALAGGVYDPDVPAVVTTSNEANVVWPGRTGFFGTLDVPHGALLTSLHGTVSFLPCHDSDGNASFQVWRVFDAGASGLTLYTGGEKATWDAAEGFTVRLWRQNAITFGESLAATGSPSGTPPTPPAGYAEVIWEEEYDLSGVTEPTAASNGGYSDEHFVHLSEDLTTLSDLERLRVDRRHYVYYFTVEFWIGSRLQYNDGVTDRYTYPNNPGGDIYWRPVDASAAGYEFPSHRTVHRADEASAFPTPSYPEAKFRGLRVGWLAD